MNPVEDTSPKELLGIQHENSEESQSIRQLAIEYERGVVEMLSRTFRDNPLNRALIGVDSTRRMRSNRAGMRASLTATRNVAARLVCAAADEPEIAWEGALIGFAPGAYPAPAPPILTQLRCFFVQGPRVANRWSEVFRQLDAIHPVEPHAYLGILGVAVSRQGQGVGSRLLNAWLGDVDAEGVPSYLETDKETNVVFYQRAGFEVIEQAKIYGTRVWCMRRPAKQSPHDR